MKKRAVCIFLCFSALVIAVFSFLHVKQPTAYLKTTVLYLNENTYISDVLHIKNGKIEENRKINTAKTGEQEFPVTVIGIWNMTRSFTFSISVKDKNPPQILCPDHISITEGDQDLFKGVSAADDSNEKIDVKVAGFYDVHRAGTYTICYTAVDSGGNQAKKEIKLIVKAKQVSVQPKPVQKIPIKNVTFTTAKGFEGVTKSGVTYMQGVLIANKTYPLPSNYGKGLTKETQAAFNKMQAAAAQEGKRLKICSGFRSYTTQKTLYNHYVKRDGKAAADTYSARPGYSEHQSGLAFDVNTASAAFTNTPEAAWFNENCYKYGFILRYPNGKEKETGYIYEPWHFRYVGETLAQTLYNNGDWITLENYFGITSKYDD